MLGQPGYSMFLAITMLALLLLSARYYIPLALGSLPLIAILSLRAVQATLGKEGQENEPA